MSLNSFALDERDRLGRRLTGIYARTLVWYLLGVILLWLVGFESIYGHPTPFYALFAPAFDSVLVPGALGLIFGGAYFCASRAYLKRPRRSAVYWALGGTAILSLLLAALYQEAANRNQSVWAQLWDHLPQLGWHVPAVAVFICGLAALLYAMKRLSWFDGGLNPQAARRFLAAAVLFAIVFSCAVAMIRGGPQGIEQAYQREAYEYVGDIGKTPSIRTLFERYLDIRPYLSMHAKVHPPGPIALLWLLSYGVGRSAMALSLATIFVGGLALVPLYFWSRELTNQRVALTCCLLYALVPSVVLFSATSADILFTPVTLGTLYLFDRSLRRDRPLCAVGAGAGYGVMILLKFSLIGIGAYFAFAGLWFLTKKDRRPAVIWTAVLMLASCVAFQFAVWWWSGFDVIACFQTAKAQFDADQFHLDQLTPRYPGWMWRILNPACWFFFAGIPVSLLFLWRLARPEQDASKPLFLAFALTLVVLNLLYLARGEGERSALYIFPFLVLPAAHALDRLCNAARSITPLAATLAFLAFQCWFVESYFYTYW